MCEILSEFVHFPLNRQTVGPILCEIRSKMVQVSLGFCSMFGRILCEIWARIVYVLINRLRMIRDSWLMAQGSSMLVAQGSWHRKQFGASHERRALRHEPRALRHEPSVMSHQAFNN